MSGYLYFSNNLKDIKDHIWAYMISFKFFPINGKIVQKNLSLQLSLIFYSSITFVLETVFIPEQIVETNFGALLEIGVTFITKLIVFSYMISDLKQFGKLITILYGFKNSGQVVLPERPQFAPQKLRIKLFRNGRRYKDKAQCLLPCNLGVK